MFITQIDAGNPSPRRKWPWLEINVGEAFIIDAKNLNSARALASRNGKEIGREFRAFQTSRGIRIARVA